MVSIDASGLRFDRASPTSDKTASSVTTATPTSALSALTNWPESLGQSQSQVRQGYQQNALLDLLDKRLSAFETALRDFQWPATDFPWRNSRLTDKDPALDEKLSFDALGQEEIAPFYKYRSAAVDLKAEHGLKSKTYSLKLSLGGQSETLRVALDQSDKTWGDALEKISQAVNDSELPVQASMQKSGRKQVLALSVDAGLDSQDLRLELEAPLRAALDFKPVSNPLDLTPSLGTSLIQVNQRASETVYQSSDLDPNAAVTLQAGAYSIGYSLGAQSGDIQVSVNAGDTWRDLLKRVGNSLAQVSGVEAEVESTSMSNYALGYRLLVESERLTVTSASDKLDARLRLSEGLVEQSASFYDPNSAETLPVGEQGQIFIAADSGQGWTQGQVYTYGGQPFTWIESDPAQGEVYAVAGENYRYDESQGWIRSESLLTGLGLGATGSPGSDASIRAQGQTQTGATGVFGLDQGRASVTTEAVSTEKLPVSVVQGMSQLGTQLNELVASYNALQDFFKEHKAELKSSFVDSWQAPLELQKSNLKWLGVNALASGKTLWVNGDAFAQALYQDPERAQGALVTQTEVKGVFLTAQVSGLVPAWSELAAKTRDSGLESTLVQTTRAQGAAFTTEQTPTLPSSSTPPWRKNLENEADEALLDLFG